MSVWIDYGELRRSVDFAQVLRDYHVDLRFKGDQGTGFCPLPNHQGQRRSPSFSVNLARKCFNCFSCGCKGNCIELVAMMEGLDPEDEQQFRKAALLLHERYGKGGDTNGHEPNRNPKRPKRRGKATAERGPEQQAPEPAKAIDPNLPRVVNAPLDFELRHLDQRHPYLLGRGFTTETVLRFGVGYCSRGLLKDRVAIPLHDGAGKLVGYAGRVIDDACVSTENPKYRFPGERVHEGVVHEFRKSLLLYNGFNVGNHLRDLIVVEGFASVWWLWQHGYPDAVALMGWSCSLEQTRMIVDAVAPDGVVWAFTDGDNGGERCAASVLSQVASHRLCRRISLTDGRQPTDCSPDELARLLPPRARKSGTSETPDAANPRKVSSAGTSEPTAAMKTTGGGR